MSIAPLTEIERDMLYKLRKARLSGTRFVGHQGFVSNVLARSLITFKEQFYLAFIFWHYREQFNVTDAEARFLISRGVRHAVARPMGKAAS